jgi:hypothetical protein
MLAYAEKIKAPLVTIHPQAAAAAPMESRLHLERGLTKADIQELMTHSSQRTS